MYYDSKFVAFFTLFGSFWYLAFKVKKKKNNFGQNWGMWKTSDYHIQVKIQQKIRLSLRLSSINVVFHQDCLPLKAKLGKNTASAYETEEARILEEKTVRSCMEQWEPFFLPWIWSKPESETSTGHERLNIFQWWNMLRGWGVKLKT